MLALIAAAALLVAAQDPPVPQPPPEVEAAMWEWAHCLGHQVARSNNREPPQRVADSALGFCRHIERAMVAAHGRWVKAAPLSEAQKREARRNMADRVRRVHRSIPDQVRAMRAGAN